MSPRALLALMIIFVALGTFAIFDPLRRKEKAEADKDRTERVAWLEGKRLEWIRIEGRGRPVELLCKLRQEGCPFDGTGEWKVDQPLEANGDPSAVGTLASTLLNLKHNEKLDFAPGQPDPREFGLDSPQATVSLRLKGEPAPLVFRLGKAAAVGPNIYLSSSASPSAIFLVPSYLPEMVNKELFHWQSKRLFPEVESTGFNRIGWTDQKAPPARREVRAVRIEGKWRLAMPVSASASQIMIEGLASTLAYAAAKNVWSPWRGTIEAKAMLKTKPELELAFSTADGKGHVVKLWPKPGAASQGPKEFVAAVDNEPAMLTVDASTFERFRKDLKEYRQRSVLEDAQRSSIDEARLVFVRERNEATFRLEKGKWVQAGGEKLRETLAEGRLIAFLDSLRDADFQGFLPLKGDSPEARAWRTQPADLSVELNGGGKLVYAGSFVVHKRGVVVTEAENELRLLGELLLQQIPVRLSDLGETANKQVITSDDTKAVRPPQGGQKGSTDGHDGRGNDPHAGHSH